jgi:predicted nucleic acid-binding protein
VTRADAAVSAAHPAGQDALWILDTDVVSELRKAALGRCDERVHAWAIRTPSSQTFLSSITVGEIERGILRKERQDRAQGEALRRWFEGTLLHAYEGRILAVDATVTRRAAALHIPDSAPVADSLIAATALVHGLVVATGNLRDFVRFEGLAVHSPWT